MVLGIGNILGESSQTQPCMKRNLAEIGGKVLGWKGKKPESIMCRYKVYLVAKYQKIYIKPNFSQCVCSFFVLFGIARIHLRNWIICISGDRQARHFCISNHNAFKVWSFWHFNPTKHRILITTLNVFIAWTLMHLDIR